LKGGKEKLYKENCLFMGGWPELAVYVGMKGWGDGVKWGLGNKLRVAKTFEREG